MNFDLDLLLWNLSSNRCVLIDKYIFPLDVRVEILPHLVNYLVYPVLDEDQVGLMTSYILYAIYQMLLSFTIDQFDHEFLPKLSVIFMFFPFFFYHVFSPMLSLILCSSAVIYHYLFYPRLSLFLCVSHFVFDHMIFPRLFWIFLFPMLPFTMCSFLGSLCLYVLSEVVFDYIFLSDYFWS